MSSTVHGSPPEEATFLCTPPVRAVLAESKMGSHPRGCR